MREDSVMPKQYKPVEVTAAFAANCKKAPNLKFQITNKFEISIFQ